VSWYPYTCSKNDVILSVRRYYCASGLWSGLVEIAFRLDVFSSKCGRYLCLSYHSQHRSVLFAVLSGCVTTTGKTAWPQHSILRPYSKSKLELESNSSEILPVNCKFFWGSSPLNLTKLKFEYLKSDFRCKKERCNDFRCKKKCKERRKFFLHHSSSTFSSSAQVCF